MNRKIFLIVTALSASFATHATHAQSGGSGGGAGGGAGSGSGSGAATGSATSSASGASSPQVGSAGGSNIGTISTSPAPNSRTAPALPPASDGRTPSTGTPDAPTSRTTLPAGLSAAPAPAGVSTLSGLPTAEIPAVSPGTAPIGADGTVGATPATARPAVAGNGPSRSDTAQIDAQAPTDSRAAIGPGVTTVVPTPPPAATVSTAPTSLSSDPNSVWVNGHYSWLNGQWNWVEGAWQRPPSAGATWVPGNYDAQTLRWTEGHWDPAGAGNRDAARARERSRENAAPRR